MSALGVVCVPRDSRLATRQAFGRIMVANRRRTILSKLILNVEKVESSSVTARAIKPLQQDSHRYLICPVIRLSFA